MWGVCVCVFMWFASFTSVGRVGVWSRVCVRICLWLYPTHLHQPQRPWVRHAPRHPARFLVQLLQPARVAAQGVQLHLEGIYLLCVCVFFFLVVVFC